MTEELYAHKDAIIAWLKSEQEDWMKEMKPGERDRNSEIAFHIGELQKLIDKLQPQSERKELQAPSFS